VSLSEVREYPRDDTDPLSVALWRDQTMTLQEYRASLDALMSHSLATIRLRTARDNLEAAQQAVREAEELLAKHPAPVLDKDQHWRYT
jgi:hypothetical protein